MASGDKTEKATQKRREDERKKGNIFQSQDITSSLTLMGLFAVLYAAGPQVFGWFLKLLRQYLSSFGGISDLGTADAALYINDFAIQSALLALPFMVTAAVLGIVFDAAQTRMNFSIKRLKPDFKKIDPIGGLKRVINAKSMVELIKSAIKIVIAAIIFYGEAKNRLPRILTLSGEGLPEGFSFLCDTLFAIAMKTGLAMTAFGILDYFYQWWSYERQIRMTKQEIKDEFKQTEGDPKVKGHIRELQRRMASMRMMQNVPQADVVIRNPTHFAVAIRYDKEKNRAPIVVAKGKDYVALKIVEIAEAAGVSVTENPPLARGLYAAVEIGREIPAEYYQAVAEVLAFVYGLKRRPRRA